MRENTINQLSCEVVEDLLPLYADEICSEASKELVEQHLGDCEHCKSELETMKNNIFEDENLSQNFKNTDFTMKRAMRKVRLRWVTSIFSAIVCMMVVVQAVSELTGTGIEWDQCYGSVMNVGNWVRSEGLKKALMNNEFEAVFNYIDVDRMYRRMTYETIIDESGQSKMVGDMEYKEFGELCRKGFVSKLDSFIGKGYEIAEVEYIGGEHKSGQNNITIAITYKENGEGKELVDWIALEQVGNKFVCIEYESDFKENFDLEQAFCFKFLLKE